MIKIRGQRLMLLINYTTMASYQSKRSQNKPKTINVHSFQKYLRNQKRYLEKLRITISVDRYSINKDSIKCLKMLRRRSLNSFSMIKHKLEGVLPIKQLTSLEMTHSKNQPIKPHNKIMEINKKWARNSLTTLSREITKILWRKRKEIL